MIFFFAHFKEERFGYSGKGILAENKRFESFSKRVGTVRRHWFSYPASGNCFHVHGNGRTDPMTRRYTEPFRR